RTRARFPTRRPSPAPPCPRTAASGPPPAASAQLRDHLVREATQAGDLVLERAPAAAVQEPRRRRVVGDAGVAEAPDRVGVEGIGAGGDDREGRLRPPLLGAQAP